MKAFLTPSYTFTPGASGVGTLDLSSIASFDVKKLVAVINQTSGVTIYATGTTALRYTTESSGLITLFYNTSAMSGSDKLQVIYDQSTLDIAAAALPLPSGAATSANQASELTLMGAVTETAPASDTDPSGLNGRLQRLAQGITSLIALVPASLGQKTMANAFAVSIASDQSALPIAGSTIAGTVTNAVATVGLTAVRATVAGTAPSVSRKLLIIKPSKNNTGSIYIGSSSVTTANGLEIIGPDRMQFEFDSGDFYLISDVAAQSVEIIEKV